MTIRSTEPIGVLVERYRDEQGLRQSDLAAMMEVNPSTVSRLEKRQHYESLDPQAIPSVEAFARVLGRPPEFFREYADWKAKRLVEEAMAAGLIDLEDIELILAAKR